MLKLSSDAFSKYLPFLDMTVKASKINHHVTEDNTSSKKENRKDQQEEEVVVSESTQVTQRPGSPLYLPPFLQTNSPIPSFA